MADTDILAQLLPSLLQGSASGLGSTPSPDPDTIGAIKAMQAPFLQGEVSHSGPMGQIGQALMPLLASKIYGQQAAQQQQADKVKTLVSVLTLAKELKGYDLTNAKTQAELKKLGIESDFLEKYTGLHHAVNGEPTSADSATPASTAPAGSKLSIGGLTIPLGPEKMPANEIGLMDRARTDPEAAKLLTQYEAQRDKRAKDASQLFTDRTNNLLEARDAEKARVRLDTPAYQLPEYRNKVLVDKNTLKAAPQSIPTKDVEATDSPYASLTQADIRTVRGAKQITQQLDRLEQLIPTVLPESRLGLPISIGKAAIEKEPSGAAAEFDRLASFEQLKGIRDFLANQRINQAEIVNVGKLNRYTDSQEVALAKIKAMRDLVSGTISNMDLNAAALGGVPPDTSGSKTPRTGPPSAKEIGQQIEQMKSLGYNGEKTKGLLKSIYGGDIDVD